ncbi:tRNA (adenosine(37)-N6)-threonylcarbamoyltransferase complex ATPase subunit type 1 TsaE [Leeia aquatica]|uniref:tRNA (adenosine(37)-N6)-threonylcarbamoyltransferase complex ATPase subunit type 1 TsaE n=1 Tax=Leeia aquatica TaxID=2725557 RepID=UPI0027E586FF|nr:tRNA (adenosine(37)-N6)-threonylcarbamoyltransferase complex ATPase subunit type 1 TsaE [Leeia aquatica]
MLNDTPTVCFLPDEAATLAAGAALAGCLQPGMVLTLQGDLGAGKTTFSRGLLRALGVTGRIKSPSYSLVEPYVVSNLYLYHFDFYRFEDAEEWQESGFREYFHADSICLVEWPEKAAGSLPEPDLALRLNWSGEGRELQVRALSPAGAACLNRFPLAG